MASLTRSVTFGIRSSSADQRYSAARIVFRPKDALKRVVITGATVVPDGASVVYAKCAIQKGTQRSRLWRVPIEGGRPERLTTAAVSDTDGGGE